MKFSGKVLSSCSGQSDILYDDLVNGKKCIEKNVSSNRIFKRQSEVFDPPEDISFSSSMEAPINVR